MIVAELSSSSSTERLVVDVRAEHERPRSLWWEIARGTPPRWGERLDHLAIALAPMAMAYGQDLHLEGPVARTALAGLEEFGDAWHLWRPDLFHAVSITAGEVVDDRREAPGPTAAVCAFSGGVDGTYATLAHARGLLGGRSLPVAAAVLVHGFDIDVDDHYGFGLAERAAEAVTDELGVDLVTVRTNWRREACPDWQMTFGAAAAAVLHLFADRAGTGVLAADTTYGHLTVPWGSNPVTNPLLSTARFRLTGAGAGIGRTAKCAAIGRLASVRDHVRVCWAGPTPGANCGRCEKCIRTKVNFLAAGIGEVAALGPLAPGELAAVTIGSEAARSIYEEMRADLGALPVDVARELLALLDEDS